MRVVRGAAATPEADRAATAAMLDRVESDGEAWLRVWQPPRHVAFGRRDAAAEGYERAREAAGEHGYEPIERSVGGRAVAHTGTTVSFAYAVSNDDGIQTRYRGVTGLLKRALQSVDVTVQHGEPAHSFCPGTHSLQNRGKIVGLAQRVRRDAALVAGYVVVRREDEAAIATALMPVYRALGVPFDPESVGSVEGAGGPADPQRVLDAIESAFSSGSDYQSVGIEALAE